MNNISAILDVKFFDNSILNYLTAFGLFLLLMFFLRILQWGVLRKIKAWVQTIPDQADNLILRLSQETLIPLLYLGAFYFALQQLVLSPAIARLVNAATVIILTFQVTRLILSVIAYFLERTWFKTGNAQGATPVSKSVLTIIKLAVWSVGAIFLLDNLGFNVSAIVAGLGIGGIAVALAAQTILGDLFNYFVIFFDRPFEEGDFVVFDDYLGVIENIGIKSTRLRSIGGEQIVISNTNLTGSKIRNYKRMAQRRVLFKISVVYETPKDKLKKIPGMLRSIIESMKNTRVDRAHFKDFGDFSLNFEVVYFVLSSEYNHYMDIQELVNFSIIEAFEKEGIEFAYPTSVQYQKSLKI